MERLLHYVWKYKLYARTAFLQTTQGEPVQVLDPGLPNNDAGPDFFNAKIRIDNTLWSGNVEIHDRSTDWFVHGHHADRNYDSVILHVVGEANREISRLSGEMIPQLVLQVPETVRKSIDWLLSRETALPCSDLLAAMDPLYLSAWIPALLSERMERKVQDINRLLQQYQEDWNEVFYVLLTRNFGFGVNSDAFEWLAKRLPYRFMLKQRGSLFQLEAMLFGQAGLLEAQYADAYYSRMQQEYRFLKQKYQLQALDWAAFKLLRIRPGSFPHLKIAQLAALWHKQDSFFSIILEQQTPDAIRSLFQVMPSEFWKTHYHFSYASAPKEKPLGESSLNVLLINTVVPLLFAYGMHTKQTAYCDRAMAMLEALPAEQNAVVRLYVQAGVPVKHAGESQALIQLKRMYCEKKKCLYCRWGFQLLKQGLIRPFA